MGLMKRWGVSRNFQFAWASCKYRLIFSKDPHIKKGAHQMRIHTLEKTDIVKLKDLFDVYCEAFEEVHPFPSDVAWQRLMDHPVGPE